MLVTIISTLIFTKKRKAMQLIPESVRKLWSFWELRAMVLISLGLQTILILIGNWRKQSTSNILRIVLWLAYLSADSIATVSLGVLSSNQEDSIGDSVNPDYVIAAFWAPFLLLHLGGPDTIAAYSLEDNELWLRHLLVLVVQGVVALNVSYRAWSSEVLNFLAIPMFIVGIMKFWERIWVLRSQSSEQFRDSMLRDPDPGPNYARYMEEYSSRKAEGFRVKPGTFIDDEDPVPTVGDHLRVAAVAGDPQISANVNRAYSFFKTFKRLCADLILSFHDIESSQSFFQTRGSEEALQVIEFELGFMYDVFYTKALQVYSGWGCIRRCITLSLTVFVLVFFHFTKKQAYKEVDVIITYILLVGGMVLEMYAVVLLLSSDWTKLWLAKHKSMAVYVDLLHQAASLIPLVKKKSWSNSLAQYNLITFSLKDRPAMCICIQKVLFIDKLLEKHRYKESKDISKEFVKKLIFEQLQWKSESASDFKARKQLCARKGDWVLDQANCKHQLGWAIDDVEFDQSILLWHIATDLCYNSDMFVPSQNCEASKLLSEYMLYLLVMCPFMLPNGIGEIRFRDTCAEAGEFFKERKTSKLDEKEACTKLLEVCIDILPSTVKGDRSKSVLFDACRLAKDLQSLDAEEYRGNNHKKWELISHVWVEMLSYAANQCRWSDHAQQLRRGGELLTHVWLLMAHLGITEQFQISVGHKRSKLVLQ